MDTIFHSQLSEDAPTMSATLTWGINWLQFYLWVFFFFSHSRKLVMVPEQQNLPSKKGSITECQEYSLWSIAVWVRVLILPLTGFLILDSSYALYASISLSKAHFLPFFPQEKLWAWCSHPVVWHFAQGSDCVVRRRFRFFNQLRGGWFHILLECRGLSTGVWISHLGNRSMCCCISVSGGTRRMDDLPFYLADVTSYMILIILNLLILFLVTWYDLSWWMFYVHFKWALPWVRWWRVSLQWGKPMFDPWAGKIP